MHLHRLIVLLELMFLVDTDLVLSWFESHLVLLTIETIKLIV